MRKALAIVLDLLALASFAGVYALDYFTKSKLGMTRWVNYNAGVLRDALPVDAVCTAVALIAFMGLIILLETRVKRCSTSVMGLVLSLVSAVCAVVALLVCQGLINTVASPFTLMVAALGALLALLAALSMPWERKDA